MDAVSTLTSFGADVNEEYLVADGDRGVKERQSDVLLQGWREGATRYLPHDDPGEDNVRDSMHLHVRARDAAIKAEQSAKLTTRVVDSD